MVFYDFPMVFYDFPMVFYDFPMVFYGFPVDFPGFSHGFQPTGIVPIEHSGHFLRRLAAGPKERREDQLLTVPGARREGWRMEDGAKNTWENYILSQETMWAPQTIAKLVH